MPNPSTELGPSPTQPDFTPNQIRGQPEGLASAGECSSVIRRASTAFALAFVVLGGALPRLNHIDKSIWSAEAWVANSVLADSSWHMFRYSTWLQTTPPLFLLLERGTVRVAGISVASFRAIPFGLAILSLVLMAWLSRQILRPAFAVLCTTLMALSPPAVVFSKEVKQYSGDVAASCLLLLVLWTYLQRPDHGRFVLTLIAFAAALFLSYPAVIFVPVAVIALGLAHPDGNFSPNESWKVRLRRSAAIGVFALAISSVNYWCFVRPNTSRLLTDYWSGGYPRFEYLSGVLRFYIEYFLGMFVCFYLPIGTKNILRSMLSSLGYIPMLLITVGCAVAFWTAITALGRNKRHLVALALCLAPLCALFLLNLVRLYPVNSRRLTLFMLPCMALCAGIMLQSFWTALTARIRPRLAACAETLIIAGCIVAVFVLGVRSDNWSNYWFEDEDTAGALVYIKTHMVPEDTVYVHASMEESAKLYFKILHWKPATLRYGNTGWGCCKRTPEPRPTNVSSIRDYAVRDFEQVTQNRTPGRLWLVFTGRDDDWPSHVKEEPQMIAGYLDGIGCRKELEKRFANEIVDEFVCGPNSD